MPLFQQQDREVSAAKAEAASVKAACSSQLQAIQAQLKEAQESFELNLMVAASGAMETEIKLERQLRDAEKELEELRRKLLQGERQSMNATSASEVLDGYEDASSALPSIRQQLPTAGFSQRNLLLRSAPQAKRPRTDVSHQPMSQSLRVSPMMPTFGETNATPPAQAQGNLVAAIPGALEACTPLSVDAMRELVIRNSQSLQQRTISSEMLFIQLCLRNGPTSPFKQLLQALSQSGSLGESEALMHAAELLSSL